MEPLDWPLPGLRLRTPDLLLRPTTEADLSAVEATLSADIATDPRLPRFPGLDERRSRAVAARQSYWQSVGNWSVDNWRLDFVVVVGKQIIGVQSLEGEDFLVLRTVDSASHLAPDGRGRGWGKQARRAVLALAFGHLPPSTPSAPPGIATPPRSASAARSATNRTVRAASDLIPVLAPTRCCTCGCHVPTGKPPAKPNPSRSAASKIAGPFSDCRPRQIRRHNSHLVLN